jgi:hypothetical protein
MATLTACGAGDGQRSTIAEMVAVAGAAAEPFPALTELELAIGGRCARLAVADTPSERARGLMAVTDLGPYDGMLFVFDGDVEDAFTMHRTRLALDIGWYDGAGEPVDRAGMVPCPEPDAADCPLTRASGRYRYAVEVPAGGLGRGALAACR